MEHAIAGCGESSEIARSTAEAHLLTTAGRTGDRGRGPGATLPGGYFLVLRPAGASLQTRGEGIRYFGPLASREQVEFLNASAQPFGLVQAAEHAAGAGMASLLLPDS